MDEPEDFAQLWHAALASYEKETKHELPPKLLEAFRCADSAAELLKQIEASGEAFADFRHKRAKVWGTLRKFVAPLALVLKIAIPPASVSDGFGIPASAAIGACLYLVKSCENVSQAYDWIEEVLTELQEFTERLNEYSKSEIGIVLQKKIVAILAFVLRVIGRSEALIEEHRFRLYLHVTFLGKDEKTKQLVDDLNKLFGSEQRFVLAVTYATAQRIHTTVERIDEKVDDMKEIQATIKEHVDREESVQVDARIRQLLNNTSAVDDVEETFVRNKRSLLRGTGAWLRRESLFESWIEHRAMVLWLFGGPGAGKSYLSTWLISQLLGSSQQKQQDACVAYFFVKENNEVLRDANVILKTLAWQLTEQNADFKQHVAHVSKQRTLTITAEDTWESVFLGYYGNADANPRFASIVIDGLDEATAHTRRTVLGFIKQLVSAARSSIRPMIQFAIIGRTSLRNDVDFTRLEKIYFIEISREKNREDIDNYICKRLEEVDVLREMRRIRPGGLKRANKAGAAIRTKVLDGADGVFLWAKLLIETILHKDLPQIESILKEPPADLDDMIWSVFDRLARDEELDHALVKKMLLLCGYARTPLKFGELDLFLSLPSRRPNLLVWKHTRGKLSSVFELKFPRGYNPDEMETNDYQERDVGNGETTCEISDCNSDAGGFDFSGSNNSEDSDYDETLAGNDDDDVIDPAKNQRIRSKQSLELVKTESMPNHLSESQVNTHIAFCHSRIKDYIVREGSSRRRKPYNLIIPSENEAQIQLALSCLDVLRLELSLQKESIHLVNYALRNFAQHLNQVDRHLVSNSEFCRIIEGLHWLLGTDTGAECFLRPVQDYGWEEFYSLWVGTDEHFCTIQDWLREVNTRSETIFNLSLIAREWASSAATSNENLLKKWMVTVSRFWLVKSSYDSDEYTWKGQSACWFLDGWLSLVESSRTKDHVDIESASRLEHLASWAEFTHDTHWHTSLGCLMMEHNFHDEAISHCNTAFTLDSRAWVAMECMARVYGDQKNPRDYHLAIEWQTKAIAAVPERMQWITAYLLPRLANWNAMLGNEQSAFEAAKKGWFLNYYLMDVRLEYIKALHRKGDTAAVVWVLNWLNERYVDDEKTESRLVEFLAAGSDIFDLMGQACRKEGQPAWLPDVLERTLKLVDQRDWLWIKVCLPLRITKFGFTYYDSHQDQFATVAEKFLERLDRQSSSFRESFVEDRKWVVNKLALHYFDKASCSYALASDITPEAGIASDKLKTLAISVDTSFDPSYDGFDFFREDYPALLWGRWLRDYKKTEEKLWRKCFKARLLCEMNALDDNDPANDTGGISSLAISLFHAGDRRNAAALLAVLFKKVEDVKIAVERRQAEPLTFPELSSTIQTVNEVTISENISAMDLTTIDAETQDDRIVEDLGDDSSLDESISKKSLNAPPPAAHAKNETLLYLAEDSGSTYICDNCGRNALETGDMYFCEICVDVNWCGECLAKLKDPDLRRGLVTSTCNPKHMQYQAYPIPNEARDLAVDYLEAGVQLRKEWLASLREEWMKAGV